jgi:hypothetical protein
MRQFYAIKQTTTVADFIERFDVLMNHLMSYSEDTQPYYFLTQFIEGLQEDIRVVVMIQRPCDLDTACSLALLQEEVAEGDSATSIHQGEHHIVKLPPRGSLPHQLQGTSRPPSHAEDHRGAVCHYYVWFCRAKGLCHKYGERWSHEHRCSARVQLHVMEEFLDLFSLEEITGLDSSGTQSEETEVVCSLSVHALIGPAVDTPGVIQLQAFIEDKKILILVDSGSSASFINEQLATSMPGIVKLPQPSRVNIADGTQYHCSRFIPQCQWTASDHQFSTDLKILPLSPFDAILGMDWLKFHNPDINWV